MSVVSFGSYEHRSEYRDLQQALDSGRPYSSLSGFEKAIANGDDTQGIMKRFALEGRHPVAYINVLKSTFPRGRFRND
jgi:hypothetical protein